MEYRYSISLLLPSNCLNVGHLAQSYLIWNKNFCFLHLVRTCFILSTLFPRISISDPPGIPARPTLLPCYRWSNWTQRTNRLNPSTLFLCTSQICKAEWEWSWPLGLSPIPFQTQRPICLLFPTLFGDFTSFGQWELFLIFPKGLKQCKICFVHWPFLNA